MWFYCLLLTIGTTQAVQSSGAFKRQDGQSNIKITGTGTIAKGKTSLNINVEIDGNGGIGGLGIGAPPGAGGMRAGEAAAKPTQAPTAGGSTAGRPTAGQTTAGQPTTVPTAGPPTAGTPTAGPTTGTPTGKTTPGVGGGPPGEFTKEEELGLATHNEFRQIHEVPLLTLNRKMCDEAKAYAEELAKTGTLKHSSSEKIHQQGENLAMGCSSEGAQTIEQAVTKWYDEVCKPGYDFTAEQNAGETGHFTQVVWKGSTVLGIGRAESTKGGMKCAYIVGRYEKGGNMKGSYVKNVKKGKYNPSYCESVKSNTRKYFDKSGKPVIISTPFTEVDVPNVRAGTSQNAPPQALSHDIELLNSKKKKTFVHSKHY